MVLPSSTDQGFKKIQLRGSNNTILIQEFFRPRSPKWPQTIGLASSAVCVKMYALCVL